MKRILMFPFQFMGNALLHMIAGGFRFANFLFDHPYIAIGSIATGASLVFVFFVVDIINTSKEHRAAMAIVQMNIVPVYDCAKEQWLEAYGFSQGPDDPSGFLAFYPDPRNGTAKPVASMMLPRKQSILVRWIERIEIKKDPDSSSVDVWYRIDASSLTYPPGALNPDAIWISDREANVTILTCIPSIVHR